MTAVPVALAFLAGVVAFVSPCTLPLIPAYLSFVAGVSSDDAQDRRHSLRMVLSRTIWFVIGFSLVFVTLGVLVSATFSLMGGALDVIYPVAGVVVILLGLNFIFDFIPLLSMEKRVQMRPVRAAVVGPLLLGMAFAAGWTPCVGPVLSSILLLAGTSGKVVAGAVTLGAFSAGLGVPFLAAGLFMDRFLRQLTRLRRHMRRIQIAGGAFLVVVGALLMSGRLYELQLPFKNAARALEQWGDAAPVLSQVVIGGALLLFAAALGVPLARRAVSGAAHVLSSALAFPRLATSGGLTVLGVLVVSGTVNATRALGGWLSFVGL